MSLMLLGPLRNAFMSNAMRGFALAQKANPAIGNFNALRDLGLSDKKSVIELSNLKHLERTLREVSPKMLRDFKRDARKVGDPAKKAIRQAFADATDAGPLGDKKRRGRYYDRMDTSFLGHLSWHNAKAFARRRGIEVNYKNRNENKALQNLKASGDGTISIVRVVVRPPAFIVADMAGASNSARKGPGELSREYRINLFNKGTVTRRHKVNIYNTENWIDKLNSSARGKGQSKPSRYAWPAAEDHLPKAREDASAVMNRTIQEINRLLSQ